MNKYLVRSAACLVLIIAASLSTSSMRKGAQAHDWYDAACCSKQDCAPIPDGSVRFDDSAKGYRVIYAFERRGKMHNVNALVPVALAKVSQDEHFHGCPVTSSWSPFTGALTGTSDAVLRCLYVPWGI